MELDDELCLCFHVTKRKVINYLRVEKPSRPGQLADCFGAGTGCGWCRTYLRRLFDEQKQRSQSSRGAPQPRPSPPPKTTPRPAPATSEPAAAHPRPAPPRSKRRNK